MTLRDAAAYMGCSSQHAYRLASKGKLGRTAAPFRKKDIDAYLDGRWAQQKTPRSRQPPPVAPESVTARCTFCAAGFDLAQLALVTTDTVAALACYPCLARLFAVGPALGAGGVTRQDPPAERTPPNRSTHVKPPPGPPREAPTAR